MRLWRRTSTEMAGAWRSLRYEMGRRPAEPSADGPDVTSTGMNTFGHVWGVDSEPIETPAAEPAAAPSAAPRQAPRPAALVSAFGLLTVLGAAGAYLVVVNGLVPLRSEAPAAAAAFPPQPPAVGAESGIGPARTLPRPRNTSPRPVGRGAARLPAAGDTRDAGSADAGPASTGAGGSGPASADPAGAATRPSGSDGKAGRNGLSLRQPARSDTDRAGRGAVADPLRARPGRRVAEGMAVRLGHFRLFSHIALAACVVASRASTTVPLNVVLSGQTPRSASSRVPVWTQL